ncbi:hypothetical protein CLV46_0569 [Diaminobutyricimonas aerilata]|uniref:Tetratricopeptide repeat protein n=1 Tax=Diaminobutyricimonas aerilata TaxID=1162967 RepID=A0A2M9CGN9_9MICO|nr:hypothetical protein CLV46_0569 [Diaminobutyricimonas aerilata]
MKPNQLERAARAELKTLSKENADDVARHLVMVARLIEDDPELAHRHAVSAARRAGRIGVVRETLAITAYGLGDFALALRELRTYRRISGSNDQLPMMVDSERGLGRPDRALELGRSVDRSTLPPAVQVELAIAMSGARLDLGQPEAALAELEIPQLDPTTAYPYSPALFDSYATVLDELGRTEDAERWGRLADRAAQALAELDPDGDVIEVVEEDVELDDSDLDGIPLDAADDDAADDDAADDDDEDDGDGDDDDPIDEAHGEEDWPGSPITDDEEDGPELMRSDDASPGHAEPQTAEAADDEEDGSRGPVQA